MDRNKPSNQPKSDEAALITLLKQGDKAAFYGLITAHQNKVINICYRFLLNRQDAEDTAQEVFIEVFHAIHQFRGEARLSSWIYRIAISKSLDELKKQKRKKRIASIAQRTGIDQISHWLSSNERADTSLEEKEGYAQLLDALNKLPENQRIALTLSKIEDYNNAETAEIMNTSITAVESLLYRAKTNFLKIISHTQQNKK